MGDSRMPRIKQTGYTRRSSEQYVSHPIPYLFPFSLASVFGAPMCCVGVRPYPLTVTRLEIETSGACRVTGCGHQSSPSFHHRQRHHRVRQPSAGPHG